MARSFIGIPVSPYVGVPYTVPYAPCNPNKKNGNLVPLFIDWATYSGSSLKPNVGVSVSLVVGVQNALNAIAAVYIDNTNSNAPIFVAFPDTGFVAVCGPNTASYIPVITGVVQCVIYALGITTGLVPKTIVFLLDTPVSGFAEVEKQFVFPQLLASPNNQRNANLFTAGFNSPALGDQTQTNGIFLKSNVNQNFFTSPKPSGLFILTNLTLYIAAIAVGAVSTDLNWGLYDVTTGDILFQAAFAALANQTLIFGSLLNMSAMQVKLDATHEWAMYSITAVAPPATGLAVMICNWTYQP